MIDVVLLGYGNVGRHLHEVMEAAPEVAVQQIYNRSFINSVTTSQTQDINALTKADVYIIAVPDNVIGSFSQQLPLQDVLLVHTSGGVSLQTLSKRNRRGVFYPLQTFSKNSQVDFKNIPICIEAEHPTDVALLNKLGCYLSSNVVEVSSEKREKLHLAAVFVNNFTNHLYAVAEAITAQHEIDFDLLKPLLAETAKKINLYSPSEVQTGPAKRNDTKTIERHLTILEGSDYKALYKALTLSIQNGKKL